MYLQQSPASESDSSSVSGAKSPAASQPLLQHLQLMQLQNPQLAQVSAPEQDASDQALQQQIELLRLMQNPQALAQVRLAVLGSTEM